MSGLWLAAPAGSCALEGFIVHCSGELEGHHILSKQMARGNEEVRDLLRDCPPELMAKVCRQHNVGKFADAPEARRILLLQKVHQFGWSHMQHYINSLPWKVRLRELTLEGMLEPK